MLSSFEDEITNEAKNDQEVRREKIRQKTPKIQRCSKVFRQKTNEAQTGTFSENCNPNVIPEPLTAAAYKTKTVRGKNA